MSSELSVILNARNKASEVLHTVGQDVKVLQDGMDKFASSVQKQTQVVEVSFSSIAKAISASAVAIAAFKAGTTLMEAVGESFKQFDASNSSIKGLENTLVLSGNAAEDTSQKMRDLANQIEAATNIDANKITDIQASAFMKGIDPTQIGEASKAAAGLAEAFKTDLAGGLTLAANATKGNFDAFEALIPGINRMVSAEEKLAAVSRLASDGLSLKSSSALSSMSVFERMNVQLNNLYESLGGIMQPFRVLIFDGIAAVAGMLSNSLEPAVRDIAGVFDGLGDQVQSIARSIATNLVEAFTAGEVIIGNFGKSMDAASNAVMLALEIMRGNFEYALTTAMPEYTVWFAENFSSIMIDSFNSVATASSNLTKQLSGYWGVWLKTLDGTINSPIGLYGKLHEVAMGNQLMKGFQPITKALPEIAERVITETEKELRSSLNVKMDDLMGIYDRKIVERMAEIDKFVNAKPLDIQVNLVPSVSKEAFDRATNLPVNQTVESRILVRGPGESPAIQTAANTKILVDETKKMSAKLDNLPKAREFPVGYDRRFGLEAAVIRTFMPQWADRLEWLD